jgi:hypothetical protein
MREFVTVALLLSLVGCNDTSHQRGANLPVTQRIATGDFNLRVSGTGEMRWNGLIISFDELLTFRDQLNALPKAGRLVVQFEKGAPATVVASVSRALSESALCEHRRCAEAEWDTPRPPAVH